MVPAFVDKEFFKGFSGPLTHKLLDTTIYIFLLVIPNPSPEIKGCLYSLPNRFVYADFVMVIISESGEYNESCP